MRGAQDLPKRVTLAGRSIVEKRTGRGDADVTVKSGVG